MPLRSLCAYNGATLTAYDMLGLFLRVLLTCIMKLSCSPEMRTEQQQLGLTIYVILLGYVPYTIMLTEYHGHIKQNSTSGRIDR